MNPTEADSPDPKSSRPRRWRPIGVSVEAVAAARKVSWDQIARAPGNVVARLAALRLLGEGESLASVQRVMVAMGAPAYVALRLRSDLRDWTPGSDIIAYLSERRRRGAARVHDRSALFAAFGRGLSAYAAAAELHVPYTSAKRARQEWLAHRARKSTKSAPLPFPVAFEGSAKT